ncbi:APC family permease [Microbacterium sp. SORGH_AS_0862]|uniref:APC family permease n=1 Tax=Microbacterium sp. SORGH_AS_0862 TaxID=3041789 RepID=UPI00279187B5|nr:amino acid permease [Microbacterium sp. SORGH_AS_0862]MDQ1206414.1 APA family basic amino acid/polyamine antiporter [Microbacterium sp. SORGH_AS_0862]
MTGPSLQRRLGLGDAVAIGLGSMIGAGVFAVFAPAAQAAGTDLLVGLAIAAVVAFANATSTAQLAAAHPVAGGAWAYGRAELGPWAGFVAGWGFVIGKLASCAAMAMTFAAYAAPAGFERPVAVAAVAALTIVNLLGVTRTARLTRILVTIVLLCLAVVVAAGAVSLPTGAGWTAGEVSPYGVLQSAGLIFFAFAGYARIATMGEEVRDPARTIPRAILGAFAGALTVYAVLAVLCLLVLGPERLATASAPLADLVSAAGWEWAQPVVRVGAAAASLGALLALIAGIGRTSFAMSRGGDLPGFFAAVHPSRHTPYRAEIAVGAIVMVAVALVDLRGAIGFSSLGVLVYYLVANLAALRQDAAHRRFPRALAVLGAAGCAVLAVTLPWQAAVAGAGVLAVGVVLRLVFGRCGATRAA